MLAFFFSQAVLDPAMPISVPRKSCMLQGRSKRAHERVGFPICLLDEPPRMYYTHGALIRKVGRRRKSHTEEQLAEADAMRKIRNRDALVLYAAAVSSAKCLAHSLGYATKHGWPVVWFEQDCTLFHPPSTYDYVDEHFFGDLKHPAVPQ